MKAHNLQILQGGWIERLRELPDGCVQTCVTSPPYWGLRDYGTAKWEGGDSNCKHEGSERYYTERSAAVGSIEAFSESGEANAERVKKARWRENGVCIKCGALKSDMQLGLEKTPEKYVSKIVSGFSEVWRVLRDDGTIWVNLGDTYTSGGRSIWRSGVSENKGQDIQNGMALPEQPDGLKPKNLIGIPWRVAFALQDDGWYLRSDIIWQKSNPMPESVTDRPTKSHEYIFLLSKSKKYFYDAAAIAEPVSPSMLKQIEDGYNGHSTKDFFGHMAQDASGTKSRIIEGYRKRLDKEGQNSRMHVSRDPAHEREYEGKNRSDYENAAGRRMLKPTVEARDNGAPHDSPFGLTRNKRTVWTVATAPYLEAHFATFPEELIKPCILAGSKPGDTVLDPFFGSGTTGKVALELGRKCIGIELNEEYIKLALDRTNLTPGLAL